MNPFDTRVSYSQLQRGFKKCVRSYAQIPSNLKPLVWILGSDIIVSPICTVGVDVKKWPSSLFPSVYQIVILGWTWGFSRDLITLLLRHWKKNLFATFQGFKIDCWSTLFSDKGNKFLYQPLALKAGIPEFTT